jgi:hypothetical protein
MLFQSTLGYGGEQVIAANLTVSAPEDNCTEKIQLMTRQAQMLFGVNRVQLLQNWTGTQYRGLFYSNVTLTDPYTNGYGRHPPIQEYPKAECGVSEAAGNNWSGTPPAA